jgi:branched-chain amino acid transport system permease protein
VATFRLEQRFGFNRSTPALWWADQAKGVLLGAALGLPLAALLHTISRRTRWGTALLAVVQNRDAARLMGIPITRAIAVAFALSTLLAGVAGVLIAPLFNVNADMGTLFGLKAFAVAILGGITSAWGVMIAGLLFGMAEALITATLGSGYTQIITFALVIAVLAIRPNGLFGRAQVKKV